MTIWQQTCIPGIIGSLETLAHIEFERKLIEKNTHEGADSYLEHPVCLLVNPMDTVDSTTDMLGVAESYKSLLVKYGQLLYSMGAGFIVVTSNTAHAFYEQVQPQLPIPWINLIDATSNFIVNNYPNVKKVGILALDSTIQSGLYSQNLAKHGITSISPELDSEQQELIMRAVNDPKWGIKATGALSKQAMSILETANNWLKDLGAEIVIAGCTELSVGFASMATVVLPWVDPLDVLASITIDLAFGHRRLDNYLNLCPRCGNVKKPYCCIFSLKDNNFSINPFT
ncbi:putative aspartate racemase [Calothrix sp. NIES-4071]|nr:putative aspartate racemase [Calothrix sp. NIES-4071]BAZ55711.1 putative aspartate racemase [Calothrix sp. NIES-4105]